MWIVVRMSVPWTTVRRSSARVSCSRRKPSRHDQSRMYAFGAYWFWMPPIRSSARGMDSVDALEQELTREQRAVQLPLGEHALAHGRNASSRSSSAASSPRASRGSRSNDSSCRRFFSTFQVPATNPSTRIVWATSPLGAMTRLR